MDASVHFAKNGHVGTITFNRPKANSYEIRFLRDFNHAIESANSDDEVRGVILKSGIERFFCAGADIFAFAENSTEANRSLVDLARRNLSLIESAGKIYIAAINGHALGGGLEIAMACDFRFGAMGAIC